MSSIGYAWLFRRTISPIRVTSTPAIRAGTFVEAAAVNNNS
jgi:hypothetical protein